MQKCTYWFFYAEWHRPQNIWSMCIPFEFGSLYILLMNTCLSRCAAENVKGPQRDKERDRHKEVLKLLSLLMLHYSCKFITFMGGWVVSMVRATIERNWFNYESQKLQFLTHMLVKVPNSIWILKRTILCRIKATRITKWPTWSIWRIIVSGALSLMFPTKTVVIGGLFSSFW